MKTNEAFPMIFFRKYFLIILVSVGMAGSALAQRDSLMMDPKVDIEILLPPYDTLVAIAKRESPVLKQDDAAIRAGQWNVENTGAMAGQGRLNEAKERLIQEKFKRDADAQELQRKVAMYYADVVAYNRLYKGRNEDFLTQSVACQVAEKEYREGVIHFSEFSRQKNMLANAEAAYHESFRLYYGAVLQFEAILGVPLGKIMIRQGRANPKKETPIRGK